MINSIIKSKWIWLSLTVSLVILVVMSFYGIYYVYNSNTYWKRQFIIADGQYLVKFKTEKIVLTEDMKKWLDSHDIRQKRYYRAVIKGYGSHIQLLSGNGLGTPSVKHFFVSEQQVQIENNILKLPQGMFCGNWELIYITPEQYIFYLYNSK